MHEGHKLLFITSVDHHVDCTQGNSLPPHCSSPVSSLPPHCSSPVSSLPPHCSNYFNLTISLRKVVRPQNQTSQSRSTGSVLLPWGYTDSVLTAAEAGRNNARIFIAHEYRDVIKSTKQCGPVRVYKAHSSYLLAEHTVIVLPSRV